MKDEFMRYVIELALNTKEFEILSFNCEKYSKKLITIMIMDCYKM